jgi:nucleotide-binding universal stress UspA family protein
MSERGPILCATDLGVTGALAVDLSAKLANATGLPLHVVHVGPHGPDPVPEDSLSEAERVLRQRLITRVEAAAALLEKERLRAEGMGPHVTAELLEGRPWEEILESATRHEASLLVVGPHGHLGARSATRGGLTEHILGTTADRIVRHAACPVLVGTREGATPVHFSHGKWIVAIDFSRTSRGALRTARDLARACDGKLLPLHVVPEPPGMEPASDADPLRRAQAAQLPEAQARAKDLAALVREELGEEIAVEVAIGEPAEAISIAAETLGASMIVMGTKGRTGLAHLLLGSTAERVLRRSHVPILCARALPEG